MSHNNNTKSPFNSFITGLAIGSVLALLFAPFSGRKMRRVAKLKAKEKMNDAKTKYIQFEEESLKPGIDQAKQKGKQLVGDAKIKLSETKDQLGSTITKVGSTVSGRLRHASQKVDEVTEEVADEFKDRDL